MQFTARAKFLRFSPYKLRPLADVVRGKNVQYALNWLATYSQKRSVPVQKIVHSVAANAKELKQFEPSELYIKEIRIDEGPSYRYFKAGAMGRSNIYKKRTSHISVIVEPINNENTRG